ncbi:MAG: hypothetical protein ACRD3W_25430, partial [Terriglobales bacterium]
FGEVEGGTYIPENSTLDIGPESQVHIHQKLRTIFVWGRGDKTAVVHVHAEINEIWVWGNAEVHVHHFCPKVYASERAVVHCDAPETFVIVTDGSSCHVEKGVRVSGYGEAQIYAPSGMQIGLSGYALWHVTDQLGVVRGNQSTYRGGYMVKHY